MSSRTGELGTLAGEGQGKSLHKSSPSEKDSKPEMELEVMLIQVNSRYRIRDACLLMCVPSYMDIDVQHHQTMLSNGLA